MTIPIFGQRRAEIRLVILIVAVAATAAGLYRHRILNHDEGFTLNGAWKIFNGQEIYTDFHTYMPPGSYNFVAWLFELFGPHYWTAKLGAVAFLCLSALALYRMTRLLKLPYLACLLAAVIWIQLGGLAHIVNHNNLSAFAAVFAVAAFVEAVLKKRMSLFLIAGLLLSLTITMHQFKGGFLTVFLLSAALLPGSARLLEFRQAAVLAAAAAVAPAYLILAHGFAPILENLFIWPLTHYPEVNKDPKYPLVVAEALLLLVATLCWRLRCIDHRATVALALAQTALYLSVLNKPGLWDLLWNAFPTMIFFVAVVVHVLKKMPRPIRRGAAAVFVMMIVGSWAARAVAHAPRAGAVEAFLACIKAENFTKIYAHPFAPGMYFELGLPDPYTYAVLLTGMYPEGAFERQLRDIRRERPDGIILNYSQANRFGFNSDNIVDNYIARNYVFGKNCAAFTIMKRRGDDGVD
jgi:4-amino-4-deoxy-L-arabinose transferase-like glycosyltransferase